MADFLPFAEVCPEPVPSLRNVKCRDPDDQVFPELAIASGAEVVVTGAADLLTLAGAWEFPSSRRLSSVSVSSGKGDHFNVEIAEASLGLAKATTPFRFQVLARDLTGGCAGKCANAGYH